MEVTRNIVKFVNKGESVIIPIEIDLDYAADIIKVETDCGCTVVGAPKKLEKGENTFAVYNIEYTNSNDSVEGFDSTTREICFYHGSVVDQVDLYMKVGGKEAVLTNTSLKVDKITIQFIICDKDASEYEKEFLKLVG